MAASTPGTYTITNTIVTGSACGTIIATNPITIPASGSWLGGVSTNWFDPTNWNCTTVPTSNIDVTVASGSPNMPVVSGAGAVCRSISVNSGGSLTISGTNSLDVYGNWNNNGSFTSNNSTVTFDGAGSLGGSAVTSFNNFSISASGNVTFPTANVNVSGNWTNSGTFSATTGTVTFNGSSASTINSIGVETFYNLIVNDANGVTFSSGTNQVSNQMTLTSGIVTQNATLNILNGGSVTGASNTTYIDGFITKIGNSAFTFPVGNGGVYQPIAISAPSLVTDAFTAKYIFASPNGSYPFLQVAPTLDHVSGAEYWYLNRTTGSSNVNVTLNWNTNSGGIGNPYMLRVARWDVASSTWLDQGNGGTTGNTTAGSVITSSPVTTFSTPNSPFSHLARRTTKTRYQFS